MQLDITKANWRNKMEIINKELLKENKFLFRLLLIVSVIYALLVGLSYNEREKIKKENAKLEQQVIDYKWQLEQMEYIIKCKGDE